MLKYKLHEHPPIRFEHQIHTFRGLMFIPIALIFFVWNSSGVLLWLGLTLLLVDFIAEIVDIMVEKDARKELGGISSAETVIHVTATGFRMAALGIILAFKPLGAYALVNIDHPSQHTLVYRPCFVVGLGMAYALVHYRVCVVVKLLVSSRHNHLGARRCRYWNPINVFTKCIPRL